MGWSDRLARDVVGATTTTLAMAFAAHPAAAGDTSKKRTVLVVVSSRHELDVVDANGGDALLTEAHSNAVMLWLLGPNSYAAAEILACHGVVRLPASHAFYALVVEDVGSGNGTKSYRSVWSKENGLAANHAALDVGTWREVVASVSALNLRGNTTGCSVDLGAHIPRRSGKRATTATHVGSLSTPPLLDGEGPEPYPYSAVMTPRELVAAVAEVHSQMFAVVVRKQPGKCNLHVENLGKVTELLFTRRWPPIQSMWAEFYKFESYLNRQSDSTRHRVVISFHSPSTMLSQRQDALMVLLDLYGAKMLTRDVKEAVMPELREHRALVAAEPDLKKALTRVRVLHHGLEEGTECRKAMPREGYGEVLPRATEVDRSQALSMVEKVKSVVVRGQGMAEQPTAAGTCPSCLHRNVDVGGPRGTSKCSHSFCGMCRRVMIACDVCGVDFDTLTPATCV